MKFSTVYNYTKEVLDLTTRHVYEGQWRISCQLLSILKKERCLRCIESIRTSTIKFPMHARIAHN